MLLPVEIYHREYQLCTFLPRVPYNNIYSLMIQYRPLKDVNGEICFMGYPVIECWSKPCVAKYLRVNKRTAEWWIVEDEVASAYFHHIPFSKLLPMKEFQNFLMYPYSYDIICLTHEMYLRKINTGNVTFLSWV